MGHRSSNNPNGGDGFDVGRLLSPANAFARPMDVVEDLDLTLTEKRAILASWASDACAVEASPALRRAPGSRREVSVDHVLEALRSLDKQAHDPESRASWVRRQARRRSIEAFRLRRTRTDDGSGHGLSH